MPEEICSSVSLALGEPLFATASRVRAWLLIEQPGPWGREALVSSRLDRDLGRALHERAHATGVRALLIRRPGRAPPGPRRAFLAHTGRLASWLEELRIDDPGELLGLDWTRLGLGRPPGYGAAVTRPVYLACTNGRHDRCCATLGRPLAQALAGEVGERIWECSHFGGDRFAGNLVCLPQGVYYGRLGEAEAPRVVALYERGRLDLEHYRGRCCYPPPVQAAEHFLRGEQDLTGIDDLVAERREGGPDGEVAIHFAVRASGPDMGGPEAGGPGAGGPDTRGRGAAGPGAPGRWLVRLRVTEGEAERLLTCHATRPHRPPGYRLLDLTRL